MLINYYNVGDQIINAVSGSIEKMVCQDCSPRMGQNKTDILLRKLILPLDWTKEHDILTILTMITNKHIQQIMIQIKV